MKSFFCFLLIIVSVFPLANGQAPADSVSAPVKKVKKIGVLPVPILGYAPETRFYFGATDSITRVSSSKLEVNYTMNKQFIAEAGWNLFTTGNKTAFDGLVGFRKFPELY